MNRHYTAAEYEELCTRLRSEFEDATLTTDVMVGFSGETKEDFEISRDFVKKIGFEKFTYSPIHAGQARGRRSSRMSLKTPKKSTEAAR